MIVLVSLILVAVVNAAVPVSKGQPGFVYKGASISAPVHLDIFIDELCPDSKRAWPTVLQVADHYGPTKLKLTVHVFALPNHKTAFYAAKGAFIAAKFNESLTHSWIQMIFDNNEYLTTGPVSQISDADFVLVLSELAVDLGISNSTFLTMFNNNTIEGETRVGWKYACSRRVAETPTFMLNDVVIGYTPTSYWTLKEWRDLIDPLLGITPPATVPTPTKPASDSERVFQGKWTIFTSLFVFCISFVF